MVTVKILLTDSKIRTILCRIKRNYHRKPLLNKFYWLPLVTPLYLIQEPNFGVIAQYFSITYVSEAWSVCSKVLKNIVTKMHVIHFRPGVILGVTNPFFAKTLQHWPHMVRIGEMSNLGK